MNHNPIPSERDSNLSTTRSRYRWTILNCVAILYLLIATATIIYLGISTNDFPPVIARYFGMLVIGFMALILDGVGQALMTDKRMLNIYGIIILLLFAWFGLNIVI